MKRFLMGLFAVAVSLVVEAGTIYVDSYYVGGGSDGSQSKPFPTIAEGLGIAVSNDTVFLKNGIYPESDLTVPVDVTAVGESQSGVRVAVSGSDRIFTVQGTLRNMTVGGNTTGDGVDCSGASAWIEDCLIESCSDRGI